MLNRIELKRKFRAFVLDALDDAAFGFMDGRRGYAPVDMGRLYQAVDEQVEVLLERYDLDGTRKEYRNALDRAASAGDKAYQFQKEQE